MANNTTTEERTGTEDPREKGQKPPFPQSTKVSGSEKEMEPKPDHGEESYKGYGRLQGKAAIITGSDSGIGRAIAIAYAREGADVLIAYRKQHEDAAETERWVKQAGRKGVPVAGDVGDESFCRGLIDRAFQEFGRLDILVNNAAQQATYDGIEHMPSDEFERTFRTNIFSMFYLCKAAIPRMAPGSAIINTSSIQAYDPTPHLLPYSSTKGAIVTFTKGLAKMVAERGIRVNAVAPGPVWTPLIPTTMPESKVREFGKNTPLKRPAQPAELAPVYVFLASQEASYIVGEVIGVTGGRPLP